MKHKLTTASINSLPRCTHTSPSGRRCRSSASAPESLFCLRHQPQPEKLAATELTRAAGTLSTPEEINRFLTRVTLLRIEGRLTPKEASNYAYLCLILQLGQRAIAFHQKLRDARLEHEAEQARIKAVRSWTLPRPDRSDPPKPAQAAPDEFPSPFSPGMEKTPAADESPLQAYSRLRS
jgi:hypothetical protein